MDLPLGIAKNSEVSEGTPEFFQEVSPLESIRKIYVKNLNSPFNQRQFLKNNFESFHWLSSFISILVNNKKQKQKNYKSVLVTEYKDNTIIEFCAQ